jgi:hypothetical protein
MTVGGIKDYLKQHWPAIREQLLNGTYAPKPVRRVEIPKPDGGCASWASDGVGSISLSSCSFSATLPPTATALGGANWARRKKRYIR